MLVENIKLCRYDLSKVGQVTPANKPSQAKVLTGGRRLALRASQRPLAC
jgi:hypothetical protein